MKGVGEAGVIGAPAAVVSAIEDALAAYGVKISATPVTPTTILALLEEAATRAPGAAT